MENLDFRDLSGIELIELIELIGLIELNGLIEVVELLRGFIEPYNLSRRRREGI